MLSSQTIVLLIIVAEVLSFLVLLGLLVVLYRILIVRYKEKKSSTPRDIGTLIHITLIESICMYVLTSPRSIPSSNYKDDITSTILRQGAPSPSSTNQHKRQQHQQFTTSASSNDHQAQRYCKPYQQANIHSTRALPVR